MADEVDLTFVDENDFQKRGKWFFWSDNSGWEIRSTISEDTNDSLADISELSGERESETNSESDISWHDDSNASEQQSDDDNTEEALTSSGSRKGKRNSDTTKTKAKVSSGTQKGTRAKGKSTRKTASNNKNDNTKGKPRKTRAKKTKGNRKGKALTLKELDDLVKKLDEKRPMCWNFVCEGLKNQYVEKHFKTHREIIHEILDHKYNELRDLVLHMYSSYITLVSAVSKDVKKDRKAHLCLRWVRSLNSFLDGSSENSNVCRSVFAELATKYSSSTIRAVTGILHSLVYDFAQTEAYNFTQPKDAPHIVKPEYNVALYRMSGAAICQMMKLRKDTLSEKKGKRGMTSASRDQMEIELEFLTHLKETDKSHLPAALRIHDEGHLTFAKKEFLNFVREADLNIREYVNERNLKKHKTNFLEVVHFNVYNDEELLKSFKWSAEKCGAPVKDTSNNVIDKVYNDMLHKLCNTRTKEFFRGKFERDLATSGKVVEADQSLRDNLKTFSVAKKR